MTATRTASTARPTAQDAFIGLKGEIDELLARLVAESDDHFDVNPDTLNWGDVGTIGRVRDLLLQAADIVYGTES